MQLTLERLCRGPRPVVVVAAAFADAGKRWRDLYAALDWSDGPAVAAALAGQWVGFQALAGHRDDACELFAWSALGVLLEPGGGWSDLAKARAVYRLLVDHPHLPTEVRAEVAQVGQLQPELRW